MAKTVTPDRLLAPWIRNAVRDVYRVVAYSPISLFREHRCLHEALTSWIGNHLFLLPYLDRGGAERVHLDILAAIGDERPLVFITGFSSNRGFANEFASTAETIELPRLLNHPFTRNAAHRSIAATLNAKARPLLFSSLTTTFFELLPLLKKDVRTIWLQHAFLHQPTGNTQHRAWLTYFDRVDHYGFVSQHAKTEFEKFLFANNIPRSASSKLLYLPNAVHRFGSVEPHEHIGVLFVGRDSAEKRLDLFLAIARQVSERLPGKFRFTVVGPAHGSASDVRFLGAIDDADAMARVYADHDILAVTSYREGFPMAIMEAMAQGLAIMSTPVGDVPNRSNDHGSFITSSVEADATVKEMSAWLIAIAGQPERLEGMRQQALEQARKEFRMNGFRGRYRSLLISPEASA